MEIQSFHTSRPIILTTDSIKIKVSLITRDGKNIEFFVKFKTRQVSDNFRDDIRDIYKQKIIELIEKSDTLLDNHEIEITDKDII